MAKAQRKAKNSPETDGSGKDAATGRFLPGNRFWLARSSHGPKPKFSNPDDLWAACCEYFEWVDANPLHEDKLVTFQGAATHEPVAKMRAMTIAGLCLFIDISFQQWTEWRKSRSDLIDVISRAEEVIRSQKFAGAAADLLNANIIARDLGLSDKTELTGRDGGPIETTDTTEAARKLLFLMNQAIADKSAGEQGGSAK